MIWIKLSFVCILTRMCAQVEMCQNLPLAGTIKLVNLVHRFSYLKALCKSLNSRMNGRSHYAWADPGNNHQGIYLTAVWNITRIKDMI